MNVRKVQASMDYRFEAIRPFVTGRDVLDLGAGSGFWRADWIHAQIREVASLCIGVDHEQEYVANSRELGAEVIQGDVENLDLGRLFDVVFAGELIEHLSNAGRFLETCEKHLRPGGLILITTPNAFSLSNLIRRGFQNVPPNPDHTAWFCSSTLTQLVMRYGFEDSAIHYLKHRSPRPALRIVVRPLYGLLGDRLAASSLLLAAKYQP